MDPHEWINFVLQTSMNTSQLEFGQATHFLAHQHKIVLNAITSTWNSSIQSNAIATSLLSINRGWVSPKQIDGDIHISDLPDFTEAVLSESDLLLFHQTFQALQLKPLAAIVDASGKCIRMSSFQCTATTSSPYHWPIRKYKITRNHKAVWQLVLHPIASNTRLQVQLPDGTISGKIKQNLPPIMILAYNNLRDTFNTPRNR